MVFVAQGIQNHHRQRGVGVGTCKRSRALQSVSFQEAKVKGVVMVGGVLTL